MLQKTFEAVSHHVLLRDIMDWEYSNPLVLVVSITFSKYSSFREGCQAFVIYEEVQK